MVDEKENDTVLDVDDVLPLLFEEFDKHAAVLDKIPEDAKTKTNNLLKLFETDIFKDGAVQTAFLTALNDLSEEVGHAYHTVLAIELARTQAQPPKMESLMPTIPQQQGQSPINISTQTPSLGWLSGLWYYKGEKEKAQALKAIAEARRSDVPQISTSKEVIDILDFGRQLIPEFNRVQEFYQKAVDTVYFFSDQQTKERLQGHLRMHLNKLADIIRAFCRTIAEYRKELIGDRKRDVAKAILALKMAQAGVQTRGAPISIDPSGLAMRDRIR